MSINWVTYTVNMYWHILPSLYDYILQWNEHSRLYYLNATTCGNWQLWMDILILDVPSIIYYYYLLINIDIHVYPGLVLLNCQVKQISFTFVLDLFKPIYYHYHFTQISPAKIKKPPPPSNVFWIVLKWFYKGHPIWKMYMHG